MENGAINTAAGGDQTGGTNERIEELTTMMAKYYPNIGLGEIQNFLLEHSYVGLDDVDRNGKTILMNACMLEREDVVSFLLEKGADPNKKCKELNTAMHFACHVKDVHSRSNYSYPHHRERKCFRLVKMLLKHDATLEPNIYGWNPACYAAITGSCEVVEYLINQRAVLSASEKIKVLETLVFALSVLQKNPHFCLRVSRKSAKYPPENGVTTSK